MRRSTMSYRRVAWRAGYFLALGFVAQLHPPSWLLPAVVGAVGLLLIASTPRR